MQIFQNLILVAVAVLPIFVSARVGDVVPDAYIVVLKEEVTANDFAAHRAWANDVQASSLAKRGDRGHQGLKHTYNMKKLKGYSGTFDKETIAQIKSRADVAYVEPDRVVELDAIVSPSYTRVCFAATDDPARRSPKQALPGV